MKNCFTFTEVLGEYLKHLLPLPFHIKESFLQQVQGFSEVTETCPILTRANAYFTTP